jgi:acyl carrier protein
MDTLDQLKQLIKQEFDIEPSTIDADAPFASYDLDSLTLAELIFAIEDEFHVQVPDQAAGSVTTLREVARMVDGLIANQKA